MSVRVTNDPAEFAATVFPFLEKDPVLHTVLLSNVQDRATGVLADPSPPVFVSVHATDGQVVGASMWTPGRGIFLGGLGDALVPEVVDAYAATAPEADAVEGTATAARLFAEDWSSRFGKEYKQARGTRLHKLERFVEKRADGSPRQAAKADVALCVQWSDAFGVDVGMPSPSNHSWIESRVELGRLWLWELEGQPVCLVGRQAAVYGSTRIGPVYTPSEHRGNGYASALTAFVSRRILDTGSAACLYTDLANPTSNKIYAAIGYEPVADFVRYHFS
jgi:predicted GNAT family acetyltransferase